MAKASDLVDEENALSFAIGITTLGILIFIQKIYVFKHRIFIKTVQTTCRQTLTRQLTASYAIHNSKKKFGLLSFSFFPFFFFWYIFPKMLCF